MREDLDPERGNERGNENVRSPVAVEVTDHEAESENIERGAVTVTVTTSQKVVTVRGIEIGSTGDIKYASVHINTGNICRKYPGRVHTNLECQGNPQKIKWSGSYFCFAIKSGKMRKLFFKC